MLSLTAALYPVLGHHHLLVYIICHLVQEWHVVHPVMPVGDVVCDTEHQGDLQCSPQEPILACQLSNMISVVDLIIITEVVVEGGLAPIDDPGGEGGGEG